MDETFLHWRDSLKTKQKKRSYQHLDEQLDLDNDHHLKLVYEAIRNLNTHEFLPFIKFIKKDVRYRKGKNGIPERSLKERPIMYASHLDAHIYSFYTYGWSAIYEDFLRKNGIEESIIAYRKISDEKAEKARNKNNIQFAEEVFELVQEKGSCVAIVADITKFFDSLNHKTLKDQICKVLNKKELSIDEYKVLRSLTSYRYILKDDTRNLTTVSEYSIFLKQVRNRIAKRKCSIPHAVYECGKNIIKYNRTTIGIPQGSPASGLLANIYLATFDSGFKANFPDVIYRRYSDDIVLISPIDKVEEVFPFLNKSIHLSQLDLNPSKAFLAEFHRNDDGSIECVGVKNGDGTVLGRRYLDYLGFEFDGQNVLLRGKTLQRSYKKGDKRIGKFYERQTESNPRKPHTSIKQYRSKSGKTYIETASRTMESVGSKIESQQKKMARFLRSKRKAGKESLEETKP
jgi:RNA-directed DNA polymerase